MESTSGPRQAGISQQDCASSKLKLMVVQQVKGVDRPFACRACVRTGRPSKSLSLIVKTYVVL